MFGLSENIIQELTNLFKNHHLIEEVIIFGSRAKGNYTPGSDIDLAIRGDISSEELTRIAFEIEDLELLYKVDVLSYNQNIDTPIGRHIDRVGKTFYSADTSNSFIPTEE